MKKARWTNEAVVALARLTLTDREALFRQLDLVVEFPGMYPVRQRGLYTGARYFVIMKRWLVYYRVGTRESLILDILPARARPV